MTTAEFNIILDETSTFIDLVRLRAGRASIQAKKIKMKLEIIAQLEGYIPFTCSMNGISKIVPDTDINSLNEVVISSKSRIFKEFKDKKVIIYINEKRNNGNVVDGFIKAL